MTPSELSKRNDVSDLSLPLQALWHDQLGDWSAAHEIAQQAASRAGDWVHAYLHRKEGDVGNAGYWYARAKRTPATGSLEAEWAEIVTELGADAE